MNKLVRQTQRMLNDQAGAKLVADGEFGPRTFNAIADLLVKLENAKRLLEELHLRCSFLTENLQDLTHTQDNLIEGPKPNP